MIINIKPNIIFEVGVGWPRLSRCLKYFGSDVQCYLFEPIKQFVDEMNIIIHENNIKNIHIQNCAIYDYNGKIEIYNHLEASSIVGINNPTFQSGETIELGKKEYINAPANKGIISVDCFTIDKFDKGNIDILLIDTEGSEYFSLKYLKSLPYFISIETHMGDKYINPFIKEINEWMYNKYTLFKKTESDSFFIRKDILDLNLVNNVRLNIEI